ncbi:aminotransferase class IV [Odoribacter sp. OttesenSCG-928-J03]|nr:aminotransferase class IV [Odoribacter sp. OttesenSCG-928-J03]
MLVLLNNLIVDIPEFSDRRFEDGFSIYEVIRIFKGKPLFFKDNVLRLENSIKKSNIDIDCSNIHLIDKISELIRLNNIEEGNVKYVLHSTKGKVDEYLYEIHSSYPSGVDYMQGVNVISLRAERENPEIKYINTELRALTDNLIRKKNVYEIVLINHMGNVTEGSRSNIFFIKKDALYTAPLYQVLAGTSRKRVIDICNQDSFALHEEEIPYASLKDFDSAFITGTSPLILPIRKLDDMEFDVDNSLLRKLMSIYFSKLE